MDFADRRGADTPVCRVPTHRDASLLLGDRRNWECDKFHEIRSSEPRRYRRECLSQVDQNERSYFNAHFNPPRLLHIYCRQLRGNRPRVRGIEIEMCAEDGEALRIGRFNRQYSPHRQPVWRKMLHHLGAKNPIQAPFRLFRKLSEKVGLLGLEAQTPALLHRLGARFTYCAERFHTGRLSALGFAFPVSAL